MSLLKNLKLKFYNLFPSYRYLKKLDVKYQEQLDALHNKMDILYSKNDELQKLINYPSSGLHFKIDSLNDSLNTIFRYHSGLQLNQNYMIERVIAFTPEEAAIEHYKRYVFANNLIPENSTILDVSCGTGYGTFYLSHKASKVVGIDICKYSIDFANKFYPKENVSYIQSDAITFSSSEQFDSIVSFETIEHIKKDFDFIQNISKNLKSGGLFICSVPNETTFSHESYKTPFHFKHYTKNELIELLEKNGFKIENILHQYFDSSDVQDIKNNTEGFTLIAIARKV